MVALVDSVTSKLPSALYSGRGRDERIKLDLLFIIIIERVENMNAIFWSRPGIKKKKKNEHRVGYQLTCCKGRYPVAKCFPTGCWACRRRRNPPDSIATCNRTSTVNNIISWFYFMIGNNTLKFYLLHPQIGRHDLIFQILRNSKQKWNIKNEMAANWRMSRLVFFFC